MSGQDVVPWNLVHHSAFKLDAQNIGVLWYDLNEGRRTLMVSIFDCKKGLWRNMKMASLNEESLTFEYRLGASLFPVVDVECDRVNRLLVFGGIDLSKPNENKLVYRQIDFTSNMELFSSIN